MRIAPFVVRLGVISAGLLPGATVVNAAEPLVQQGAGVYQRWCVDCHGPGPGLMGLGLTGTAALDAKYQGQKPALLDQRTDLTPGFVAYFVRHGISVMPFFRRTEISDADLAALGTYLSRLNPDLPAKTSPTPGAPR